MAIFLGANGGDILSSRSVSDLVAGVKGKLAEKMAYLLAGEAEELLRELTERLGEDLAFEVEFCSRVAESLAELERLKYADQLPLLFERFKLMTEDHFARRGSVVAFHALTAAWYDLLIRKALELSEASMELDLKIRPPVPYCFLAAGTAGRMELTFGNGDEYFFVREDPQGKYAAYFEEFLYRVIAILELSGLRSIDRRLVAGAGVWHGTGDEWRSWARSQHHQGKDVLDARLADLREICGDATLVAGLRGFAHNVLIDEQQTDAFVQGVKKLCSMPVALGIFGGFRIERSGEHRGEFNLEEFALAPLIMNVRVLAIGSGLAETSTVDRIKGLVAAGKLGVDLAERLLKAFHVFARQKIISSIAASAEVTQGIFINPEKLSEEEEQLFKYGLEAVVNLQRIVHQTFAEQG